MALRGGVIYTIVGEVTTQVTDTRLVDTRRRLVYVLFAGATLGWVAFIATITVAAVAARSMTGSTLIAGFPLAAGALGQALGTNLFGRLSAYRGRRLILLIGPPLAACGAALEGLGVVWSQYGLLLGGSLVVGVGIGANHLIRYVAAELAEEQRRARAMGVIVWSGTIGALVGANLVDGVGRMAEGWLGTPYGGAYILAVVAFLLSWLTFGAALRPDPSRVAVTPHQRPRADRSVGWAFRLPRVQLAILALLSAQVVMVMVTTAAPLRIEDGGHGLHVVGLVISIHTVGMFAFAPLVGKMVDRLGHLGSLGLGVLVTWISLYLSATASYDGYGMLNFGLFVLGLGWCGSFVAGSALLFASAPPDIRQIVEGWSDSAIWVMVMLGSAAAGILMSAIGWGLLNLVAGVIMLAPIVVVLTVPRLRAELSG